MKKNEKNKTVRNIEKGLTLFDWGCLAVGCLFAIKVISYVYKKSLLQFAIEGFCSETMMVMIMAGLIVILLSLVKISDGLKAKNNSEQLMEEAQNYNYMKFLEDENKILRENQKLYFTK